MYAIGHASVGYVAIPYIAVHKYWYITKYAHGHTSGVHTYTHMAVHWCSGLKLCTAMHAYKSLCRDVCPYTYVHKYCSLTV